MKAGELKRILIDYQDNDELIAVIFERGTAEAEVEEGVIDGKQWHDIVTRVEHRMQNFGNNALLSEIAEVVK